MDAVSSAEKGLEVSSELVIPADELRWRADPSGGPGGQHANVTRSRVEVRFDVAASRVLSETMRTRLLEQLGPVVRAGSSEARSQARNRELARRRLAEKLAEGLRVERARRPSAPTRAARRRRVDTKRRRGAIKRDRGRLRDEE